MENTTIEIVEGGLGAVRGLRCAGVAAGFRRNPKRLDLALVVVPENSTGAGVFTRNLFSAAPVEVSKMHLAEQKKLKLGPRAVVLNSGNANATTGEPGRLTALATAKLTADLLDCAPEQVLLASTGVIGVPLPIDGFVDGLPLALESLSDGSGNNSQAALPAAQAIMTTDTVAKQAAARFSLQNDDGSTSVCHVAGMCKGSGMIQPDMATMLAVLATDARVSPEALDAALREAVATSFNKVTVDSDTSTNDSVFLLATGTAVGKERSALQTADAAYRAFVLALKTVCENLARQIARDGEGATKLLTVQVSGAASAEDADKAARSIANSPLVKTAVAGHDANWGRIAMALGKSGANFKPENVNIEMMGLTVCNNGLPVSFSETEALRRFTEQDEIVILVDLGAGVEQTTVWSCDFTHDYIEINADYRT